MALRAEEALEKSLKVEIDAMAKDADRLDGLVARAQAAIDKRQNVIELRQQQLADLGESFRQLQGSAKRWSPGCVNAAGKARQKW